MEVKELREKAEKAIEDGRLDEGDNEMLGLMLEQMDKFPESRRIQSAIREIIKRTRQVVTLDADDMETCEMNAGQLMSLFEDYPTLVVPTRKNRTYEKCLKAFVEATKEINKV